MIRSRIAGWTCIVLSLAFTPAFAQVADTASAEDPFPAYDFLEGHVDFWKNVWAVWSLGQVAIHDLERPALVYAVVDLPGPIEEAYTREQVEWIQALRESWEARLEALARRIAEGAALDEDDKALALQITTTAGTDAIADAHSRVRTQRGLRERFKRGIEISSIYDGEFRRIFADAGLPEDLAYLPHVESSFQARARSSAGAVGIWQFTRGTGRDYLQITSAIDERLDPIAAARGAARYLADAYAVLGDWPVALTSYNHGVGGMAKAVEQCGPDYGRIFNEYKGRLFGFASKNFYSEFLAAREIARDPARYFPEGLGAEPEWSHVPVELDGRATPSAVAQAWGLPLDALAELNPAWSRRAVQGGLALPKGTRVWIPRTVHAEFVASGARPDVSGYEAEGVYVVQGGDNLTTIAARHNMTLAELREMNGMALNEHAIHDGQRLTVALHAGPAIHVVGRGETLSDIARLYGMTVDDVRGLNGIPRTSSLIRVGQKLTVSGAGAPNETYVVRQGDTLSVIAQRHRMTLTELRELNGLPRHSNLIRAGQRLTVHAGPAPAVPQSQVHVVRRGETLSHIAGRYGVGLADLLSTNGLSLSSLIHPGQQLRIP